MIVRCGQMAGMGDAGDVLKRLAGDAADKVTGKLDRVELALKISVGASLLAAGFALIAAISSRRR